MRQLQCCHVVFETLELMLQLFNLHQHLLTRCLDQRQTQLLVCFGSPLNKSAAVVVAMVDRARFRLSFIRCVKLPAVEAICLG